MRAPTSLECATSYQCVSWVSYLGRFQSELDDGPCSEAARDRALSRELSSMLTRQRTLSESILPQAGASIRTTLLEKVRCVSRAAYGIDSNKTLSVDRFGIPLILRVVETSLERLWSIERAAVESHGDRRFIRWNSPNVSKLDILETTEIRESTSKHKRSRADGERGFHVFYEALADDRNDDLASVSRGEPSARMVHSIFERGRSEDTSRPTRTSESDERSFLKRLSLESS